MPAQRAGEDVEAHFRPGDGGDVEHGAAGCERRARRWATTSRTPPGTWTAADRGSPGGTRRVSFTNSGLPPARRTTSATPSV